MTAAISDYAIETYHNWTLLHALGGSNSVLEVFNPPAGPAQPLVHCTKELLLSGGELVEASIKLVYRHVNYRVRELSALFASKVAR